MANTIFREKSLKRVSSPEQLNETIKVTGPSVWLLLGAIVLLLVGALAFSVFGRLETKLQIPAVAGEGGAVCYVAEARRWEIEPGMTVHIGGEAYEIASISASPVRASNAMGDYAMHLGDFSDNDWVYAATLDGSPAEGTFLASVTLESVPAISFILN